MQVIWAFVLRKTISSKVGKRLSETAPVSVNVASQDFDIGVFLEALKYFQELNKPIKRVYRKPDYDRGGTFIWDWFSEENARHNLEIVMNNIEAVYNTVIKNNFPGIQEELAMLGKANELAVYCKFEKTYSNPRIGPELHAYYIANTDHTLKKTVRIIDAKEAEILELQVRNYQLRRRTTCLYSRVEQCQVASPFRILFGCHVLH